jgi:hypothetical protein
LLLTAAVAVWSGIKTNQARRQRAAVTAIKAAGGNVGYDWQRQPAAAPQDQQPPGPKWLRGIVGDEYFQDVVEVVWADRKVQSDDLRWLPDLPKLNHVNLSFSNVDDDGLAYLAEITTLKHVLLEQCSRVTDRGLAHLANLENIEELALMSTNCTDEAVRRFVLWPWITTTGHPC